MKATGIVRKIDELGRVVIPKEIRRTLHLKEGCPVEIYTDNGMIVLRKYSPLNAIENYITEFSQSIAQNCSCTVLICDDERVIACAGEDAENYINAPISRDLIRTMAIMEKAEIRKDGTKINLVYNGDEAEKYSAQIIVPIFEDENIFGTLILLYKEVRPKDLNADLKVAETAATFFSNTLNG